LDIDKEERIAGSGLEFHTAILDLRAKVPCPCGAGTTDPSPHAGKTISSSAVARQAIAARRRGANLRDCRWGASPSLRRVGRDKERDPHAHISPRKKEYPRQQ